VIPKRIVKSLIAYPPRPAKRKQRAREDDGGNYADDPNDVIPHDQYVVVLGVDHDREKQGCRDQENDGHDIHEPSHPAQLFLSPRLFLPQHLVKQGLVDAE